MVKKTELYLRNIIFGVADSIVSTVGLLSGIDIAGTPRHTIVLTGIVYAFVEAFSMAVGSYLSEQTAEEYEAKGEVPDVGPLDGGAVIFVSFVLAAFVPIIPYLFFNMAQALWLSIGFSLAFLFAVGIVNAKIVKVNMVRHGAKMMLLGGVAIVIGVIVGKFI